VLLPWIADTCLVQAVEFEVGELSSILWTGAISGYHLLHALAINKCTKAQTAHRSKVYFGFASVICWGVPLAFGVWVGITRDHSDPYPWCWIKDHPEDYAWIYMLFGPLVVVVVGNFIVWIWICLKLKVGDFALRFLLGYSIAFVLVWVAAIVRRGCLIGHCSKRTNDELMLARAITLPLQGFCNLIVYGYCRKLRNNTDNEHMPLIPPTA